MKLKVSYIVLIFLISLFKAESQNHFGTLHQGNHYNNFGIMANPHLVFNTDYRASLPNVRLFGQKINFILTFSVPLFTSNWFDIDGRLSSSYLIDITGDFKTIIGLSYNLSRSEDINGSYYTFGRKVDLYPGYFGDTWVFAPHFSVDYRPLVYIKHKANAIEAFEDLYPNSKGKYNAPKDGLYYQTLFIWQFGLTAIHRTPERNINITGGFQYMPNKLDIISFPELGILPIYGGINVGIKTSD